jgi:PAS domain S-box-containing protein
MDPSGNAIDDNRELRRTMRDLVALSTLPAIWTGLDPERIARSLADTLLNTLSLDLVFVRLLSPTAEDVVEVARSKQNAVAITLEEVRAAIAPLLGTDHTETSISIRDPFDAGTLYLTVTRFGVSAERGIVVAGSRDAKFPTEQDRLLLGVGANQTAIAIQQRRSEERLREQQEWLKVTLASIGDAVIATDTHGRVTFLNEVAQQLTGWSQRDAEGKVLDSVFTILNEQTRGPVESPVDKVLRDGAIVGLANHTVLIAKDGTERPIDDSAAPIRDTAGNLIGVVLTFRDVTEQRRAEHRRNARLASTNALSEASSVTDGVRGVLQAVCENLGWDVGFFWVLSENRERLACEASWHRPKAPVDDFETDSCNRTLALGEGLPGRAWSTSKPAWILDIQRDENFPRLNSAVQSGLRSALAHPVVVDDQTLGVLEFFTKRIREADADLVETLGTVTGNIGQFIQRKAAETELRQSEQELSDFFENATVGLHWVGPDGTILRANQAELEMLGYTRNEYVGRPINEFHADEDVICDILNRLQAGQKLNEYPARLRCKDGSIKDVLIDSSVMFRESSFVHTRCFTRDVTEHKLADAKIREQEQRTKTILESITDAFFSVDRNWRFVYVNRQAEELLGRTREDLLGKNLWEEFAPAVGTEFEHAYRKAIDENVTVTFEAYYQPHERWYEVHVYPSADGLSVYFRDSTHRRETEAALRESEEKLRLLADTIPQLAWMARPDGHIFWYNKRWYNYTGTTPAEVEGWGWQSVHDPVELPNVLERWTASIANGEPFEMVFPLKGADKQFRSFLTRVNPLRNQEGRVIYWFGTNTDIEDQKQIQRALAHSEEQFRQLADAMPQIVWTAGPEGRIDYMNRRWREFSGLPESLGNDGWSQVLHPDEALPARERWAASLKDGSPFEMEIRLRDSRSESYRWHLIRTVGVPNESGAVERWFGTSTDIHEQKQAEASSRYLAEASAALAGVVDYESTLQKVANLAVPYFADWSAVDVANDDGTLRRLAVAHQDASKVRLAQQLMEEYPPDPESPGGALAVLRSGKPEIVSNITDEMLVQGAKDERHLSLIRSLGTTGGSSANLGGRFRSPLG